MLTKRTWCVVAAAGMLATMFQGCGASASDPSPGLSSRTSGAAASVSATLGPSGGTQGAGQTPTVRGEGSSQTDGPVPGQPVSNIPESIAKEMGSPDARVRYRALDYWETHGTQAAIDPVYEALEDEDEAVRAKAAAILEKQWAMEQERERE